MKLRTWSLFLCTTLSAGLALTAQADVHVGIDIGVAPPIVVAPPAYYEPPPVYYAPPPPPVYYRPGVVVGVGAGHDWRDDRRRDEHWDRWHDHHR